MEASGGANSVARTREELREFAREYKRRNLPISVIVIDFFHWPDGVTGCSMRATGRS